MKDEHNFIKIRENLLIIGKLMQSVSDLFE